MAPAEPADTVSKDFVSNPEMRTELFYVSRREDVPDSVEELRGFVPQELQYKGRFLAAALASAPSSAASPLHLLNKTTPSMSAARKRTRSRSSDALQKSHHRPNAIA